MKWLKGSLTAAALLGCAAANPAGAALIFSDNFQTGHDFLTQGVEGTGWHGMITHGNVSAFNTDQQAAGKLHIQSSDSPAGEWVGGGSSVNAPFLWVGVTGDFIAETHISGAQVANWHASGMMARMPNPDGLGENLFTSQGSFSSIPRHMTWSTTNGSREQVATSTTVANLNYYQLERSGDTFTARYSNDGGANWLEIASRERSDLASAPYLEVGVFQTPVSSSSRWAQFDYFQLTGSGGLLPQPDTRILDGTSGANVYDGDPLSTGTDGLTLNLGFFADALVVGGGAGGGIDRGGGGGAGGLIYEEGYHISDESPLSITVGAGGAGATNNSSKGSNGSPSSLGSLSAAGGGGGGSYYNKAGAAGGSGGGGNGAGNAFGAGGAGTEGQGHAGGPGTTSAPQYAAGGGGGAGSAGGAGTSSAGGDGGDGVYYGDLFGEDYGVDGWFAGGGGGASQTANPGVGKAGGGNASSTGNGANAIANTGSGGGGGRGANNRGGAGGAGIVLLRYAGDPVADAGGAVYDPGVAGYTAHAFTATGPGEFDVSGVDMNARLATTVNGAITGTGWLTFAGPGTLTLAGDNNYTGTTTVSAGTLLVSGSTHAESEVIVNAGATLGGTGTIAGAATIESGASLSPGPSLGELTFLSDLTHEPGAAFQWELDSSISNADLVNVAGDLSLTGAALTLADLADTSVPLDLGTKFAMLSYDGDLFGTFDGYDNLHEFEFGENLWRINYADATGGVNFSGGAYANFVTLTAVPEPATWLLLLSALACGLLARRRRGR